jgi:hypothetical protein
MKTESQFATFKKEALASEPLMRQANLADIQIVSEKEIVYLGKKFQCTENAMNDFAKAVGMPVAFGNSIQGAFGVSAKQRVAELQKAAKVISGKNPQVTLVANKKLGIIERILSGGSILPYEMYFDVFERMMNGSKMDVSDFGMTQNGIFVSTVSRENEFSVGKFKDENFHPGLAFTNDFQKGAVVDSFINRLICTNGMVGRGFGESITYNPESMNEFFEKIKVLKTAGFMPGEFQNKVSQAIATRASFNEVKSAADLITGSSKMTKEFVDRFVPFNDIRRKFLAKGCDTIGWNAQQAQNAITDISVWDVINGITDFASHDYGFDLSEGNRLALQVKAGGLLARKSFDTQNLVHVSL